MLNELTKFKFIEEQAGKCTCQTIPREIKKRKWSYRLGTQGINQWYSSAKNVKIMTIADDAAP